MSYGMSSPTMKSGAGKTGNVTPKGLETGQIQNFTPEMMDLFSQMFSHLGPDSFLSKLASGDQSMFDEIEAPAKRQFNQLQGAIGSKFGGMGMGNQRSSGFQNTITQAGSDFAQDLQSKRQELRQQALRDLMGMSNMLLKQEPYDQYTTEKQQKQKSGWGGLTGAGLGAAGGFFLGGPMGAMQGAQTGYQVGSQF